MKLRRHHTNSKRSKAKGTIRIPSLKMRIKTRRLGLLLAILLLYFFIPIIPVQAEDTSSIVGQYTPQIKVAFTTNSIIVNNNQFMFELFNAGYDKISYPNGQVAIYDNRLILEYQQGTQWRQRGIPTTVTYQYSSSDFIATRHYTDSISTTYDIDYLFSTNKPVKISVTIHSGQTSNYRLVWSASGITAANYQIKANQLDFGEFQLDWNDAYQTLGDITTYSMSTVAQGRKADIIFGVGTISAGQSRVIDPSVVSTSSSSQPVAWAYERKLWYANGRYWAFYYTGTYIAWRSSTDGVTWGDATNLVTCDSASQFTSYVSGTTVFYSDISGWTNVGFRKGTLNADGTITWADTRKTAVNATAYAVNISADSTDHAFISYNDSSNNEWVTRNDNTNGTWATTAGFPNQLGSTTGDIPTVVPLGGADMMSVYNHSSDGKLYYEKYTSGSWSAEATADATAVASRSLSVTSDSNGEVYLTYLTITGSNIYFNEYTGGAWAGATLVSDQDRSDIQPVISWIKNDDVAIFFDHPTADHIYYRVRKNNTWGDVIDWIDVSGDGIPYSSHAVSAIFSAHSDITSILYMSKTSNPYNVNFSSLTINYDTAPTVTNAAADTITETGAKLYGEITATGGVNATHRGFEWDTNTGSPYANSWDSAGDYSTGTFNHSITSLPPNTTIYWRAYATNSVGTSYSGERNFNTLLPLPNPPTAFTATQTGTNSADLSWTKGAYATNTVIRGKEDSPPTNITDGYSIYNSTGTSVSLTGLSLGTATYYYRAWSTNTTGTSVTYASINIGGSDMILLAFIALFGILLTVNVMARNSFIPIKLMAAFAWTIPLIWVIGYPPSFITTGSNIQVASILIIIGMLLICGYNAFRQPLQMNKTTNFKNGYNTIGSEGGAWHLPGFMSNNDSPQALRQQRMSRLDAYRDRAHNALYGGRKRDRNGRYID